MTFIDYITLKLKNMENIENSQEVIGSRIADSNYGNVVGESTLATRNSKEAVSEELKSSTLLESPCLAFVGLVLSGLVWSGLAWPGLAWPGLVW